MPSFYCTPTPVQYNGGFQGSMNQFNGDYQGGPNQFNGGFQGFQNQQNFNGFNVGNNFNGGPSNLNFNNGFQGNWQNPQVHNNVYPNTNQDMFGTQQNQMNNIHCPQQIFCGFQGNIGNGQSQMIHQTPQMQVSRQLQHSVMYQGPQGSFSSNGSMGPNQSFF